MTHDAEGWVLVFLLVSIIVFAGQGIAEEGWPWRPK